MSSRIVPLAIPKWGIEMAEGTVNRWLKAEGDAVAKGEELVEIESDKIVNALECPADGVLRRRIADEGESLGVGSLIGVIAGADASDEQVEAFASSYQNPEAAAAEPEAAPAAAPEAQVQAQAAAAASDKPVRVSPPVRRLAERLGVDLGTVQGSGRNGRITQEDVERVAAGGDGSGDEASASEETTAAAPADVVVEPLSATRRTISERLQASKRDIPHFYLTADLNLDAVKNARAQFSFRASLNDILSWCCVRALVAEPGLNGLFIDDAIHRVGEVNLAFAVAADRGLMTPVVHGAEKLDLKALAERMSALATRAREGDLKREDMAGATFTVSNLGMFGVTQFDAIINPPQLGILALGEARQAAAINEEGNVHASTALSATLSCDHRVVDGALGGQFLKALRKEVETFTTP
ncbi:MAG: dihydrolipoamide acetyltransferase family protein [Pseudomonadota bacterium]